MASAPMVAPVTTSYKPGSISRPVSNFSHHFYSQTHREYYCKDGEPIQSATNERKHFNVDVGITRTPLEIGMETSNCNGISRLAQGKTDQEYDLPMRRETIDFSQHSALTSRKGEFESTQLDAPIFPGT